MNYIVDFITKNATDKLTTFEKVKMIIRLVRQNRVLIIEDGLSPEEEAELIKQTMNIIDFENFIGLEFFNWNRNSSDSRRFFKRTTLSGDKYTVVAPSAAVQIIENNQELLSIKFSS